MDEGFLDSEKENRTVACRFGKAAVLFCMRSYTRSDEVRTNMDYCKVNMKIIHIVYKFR